MALAIAFAAALAAAFTAALAAAFAAMFTAAARCFRGFVLEQGSGLLARLYCPTDFLFV